MSGDTDELNQEVDLDEIISSEQLNQEKLGGDEPTFTAKEQAAYDKGWRPESEFKGDNDDWKSAREFTRDGEFIDQIKSLQQDIKVGRQQDRDEFDKRLDNSNKLHEARRVAEIKSLRADLDESVKDGDLERHNAVMDELDELDKQKPAPKQEPKEEKKPSSSQEVSDWIESNPWINDETNFTKRPAAQALWKDYIAKNPASTDADALAHVDSKINELYPTKPTGNPRREQPNSSEGRQRSSRQQGRDLAMSDLTTQELADWNSFGQDLYKDEKEYLQTVSDIRKEK